MHRALIHVLAAGLALAAVGVAAAADGELLLIDFEAPPQGIENADRVRIVSEHATQGKSAGEVKLDQPWNLNLFVGPNANQGGRWAEFEQLVIDVYVDGGPVAVSGFIRDPSGPGWWDRHNFELALQPGKRRISFPLTKLTRQNGNGNVDPAKLDFIAMAFSAAPGGAPTTIWIDNARLVKGAGTAAGGIPLFSFDGADHGSFAIDDYPEEFKGRSKGDVVAEHATDGGKALRLASGAPAGNAVFTGFPGDWSAGDALAFDAFNAADHPVAISGWVRSRDPAADWWHRANWERVLRPGMNAVRLPLGGLVSPGGEHLDAAKVFSFNIAVDRATVFIDRIRVAAGGDSVAVAGMRRFDFGPANSAVMPGFELASRDSAFSAATGWGWQPGGTFGRDFDIMEMLGRHRPPDDLCRDFCMPIRATFSVAVPDGRYGVWLMLAPPGTGWGQAFAHRAVAAEGKVVVDERFDAASFKQHEFHFEDAEDLPGDDLWERYIAWYFKPHLFDVDVADGRLDLDFDGDGQWWSAQVNGLMVWPKAVDDDAKRAIDAVDAQRKEQWQQLHVEQLPPAPTAAYAPTPADQARGYARFAHPVDRDVQVNSVPTAAEAKADRLVLRTAPGQLETGCIGVHPLEPCGKVTVELGDLAGPGGAKIARAAIRTRVVRYKASNYTAVYTPIPKFVDDVPADGIELKPGVFRSLWFTVKVPADAKPGDYQGRIRLTRAGGKSDDIAMTLRVDPFALAEIGMPIGMFNTSPLIDYAAFDGEANWKAIREMMVDAREHGQTSLDPAIGMPLQAIVDGKARVRFDDMDRWMAMAREVGFDQEIDGYGVDTGLPMRPGADLPAVAAKYGVADFGAVVKAYFDAVREHAQEKRWLPICFCLDDEYVVHPGGSPEGIAAFAKVFQDNAPGFHFVAYDSSSMDAKAPDAARRAKICAQVDTWGAGLHSDLDAQAAKQAGHRLWLYNTGMNRYTFGLYQFFARERYGVSGFFQWTYNGTGSYGHYYFASYNEGHYGVVYPSSHGLRPSPIWERIAAGCTDHRYLMTAKQRIAAARKAGKGAGEAAALEKTIDAAFANLRFGSSGSGADAAAAGEHGIDPSAPGALDALRAQLADGIVAVDRALAK